MKKTLYIAPETVVTRVAMEQMIALSGPETTEESAKQDDGMDVKEDRRNHYNVWDDDWSKQ